MLLLESKGYKVDSVATDDDAMALLREAHFDLILLGRDSLLFEKRLDQRIRQNYPRQLTLKIQPLGDTVSVYPSRTVDPLPDHVVEALGEMLSDF
jgi:hypothetical protein